MVGALCAGTLEELARARARRQLSALGLRAQARPRAAGLTLPDRKRLEVARALATRAPPAAARRGDGRAPPDGDRRDGRDVPGAQRRDTGLTILLIEHVMRAVMALSQHIVVLHHGEKIGEGTPETSCATRRCSTAISARRGR